MLFKFQIYFSRNITDKKQIHINVLQVWLIMSYMKDMNWIVSSFE